MKAFRSNVLRRADKLQRKETINSTLPPSGSKASRKKERTSDTNVSVAHDIRVSYDPEGFNGSVHDDEDFPSGTLSVVPAPTVLFPVSECTDILLMTIQEIEIAMKEKFKLAAETNLREAILLDYYVAAIYWAQQQNYTATKLADFAGVAHALIQKVSEEHASLVELIKELQLMIYGSDKDSRSIDKSLQFFSKEETKVVALYFYSSLFQHHKLYHYVFSRGQAEEMIKNELSVELPLPAATPWPPDLHEAMLENIVTDYLLITTPPSEAEMMEASRTPSTIELPSEITDAFARLTLEDVKKIINETSVAVLSNLQADFESKMKTHEANVLGRINKIRGDETSNTALR